MKPLFHRLTLGGWAASLILLAGLSGCKQAPPAQTTTTVNPNGATIAEITSNPSNWTGQTVTVSGPVQKVLTPRAFTFGDQGLLAVAAQPLSVTLNTNDVVQVTGTVRNFVLADIQKDANLDLDADTFATYNNQPVIVATKVDVTAQTTENHTTVVKPTTEKHVTVVKPNKEPDVNVHKTEKNVTMVQPPASKSGNANGSSNTGNNADNTGSSHNASSSGGASSGHNGSGSGSNNGSSPNSSSHGTESSGNAGSGGSSGGTTTGH